LESSVALLSGSIVERDQLQTHLAHEATHDSLTGVANRPAAIAGIAAAMVRSARSGAATAVLFVDLNEFKAVNDSHGHEIGDEVLRQAATRMSAVLRAGDFLARLGGDEFVIVAEAATAVAGAVAVELAHRVLDTLAAPMYIAGAVVVIGAAIGIALSLDGPEEPLRLLARADAAMYRAKGHETSAVELFDADLQRQMIERKDIETALAAALADPDGGGLTLVYQPVISAHHDALIGVEALIRWQRPGHHRILAPAAFIPIAEATTLIIELDRWVLQQATMQLAAWAEQPELAHLWVSVNISGRHLLSHQLPTHITAALQQSQIDPRRLGIEITETVLLTDLIAAAHQLEIIRGLGINVAIDDFGTGYTSLAHLQHLPIDTIKIDRSFTAQLDTPRGYSLVQMIADLGHAIGGDVTAEGVETPGEQAALQAIGVDHLQGHHLSPPITPAALAIWAREGIHAGRVSLRTPADE
jgi:diguanylate cyclase (GGDEF)-like protein